MTVISTNNLLLLMPSADVDISLSNRTKLQHFKGHKIVRTYLLYGEIPIHMERIAESTSQGKFIRQ